MLENHEKENNKNVMKLIAVAYLALPVILFFSFWLRLPYNLFAVSGILFSIYILFRDVRFPKIDCRSLIRREVIVIFLMAIIFSYLSGAGGYVWQKPDWTKHNVILNDLINYSWPVYYGKSYFVEHTTLVYYIAYYLPAALIGKLFGWGAAQFALFVYTALGLFIFGTFAKSIFGKHARWLFPLFFFLSGLDIFGIFITHSWIVGLMHIEQYTSGLQFSSIMTILTWVPQHGLAAWIPLSIFYLDDKTNVTLFGPLIVALTFLWSPFVAFGLSVMWLQYFDWRSILNRKFIVIFITSVSLILIMLLYFKSQLPLSESKVTLYLTSVKPMMQGVRNQLFFLSLDLLFLVPIFLLLRKSIQKSDKLLFWISVLVLIIISQIMYGQNNDFIMRASIPHLSLIFILILKYLPNILKLRKVYIVFISYLLLVGSVASIIEVVQLFSPSHLGTNEKPIYNLMESNKRYGVSHQQYMGLATKAFGRLIGNYDQTKK